jgi:hypothetical protein
MRDGISPRIFSARSALVFFGLVVKYLHGVLKMTAYTLCSAKRRPALAAHKLESRLEQGSQLRSLYRLLGHDRRSVSKFLRVTPRTVYSWETARCQIPFATLKLLRLMVRTELPGKDWQGWSFNRGTLWSPEGHGFKAHDFSWLSLTIRQARMFRTLYSDRLALRQALQEAMAEAAEARTAALIARGHAGLVELASDGALPHIGERGWRARAGEARPEHRPREGCSVTPSFRLTGETAEVVS